MKNKFGHWPCNCPIVGTSISHLDHMPNSVPTILNIKVLDILSRGSLIYYTSRTCGNSTACVCYLNWKPVEPPPPQQTDGPVGKAGHLGNRPKCPVYRDFMQVAKLHKILKLSAAS